MRNNSRWIIFLLGVLLCWTAPVPAAFAAVFENARREVLDNGLTVLIDPIPTSPAVAIYALVKTGSATEGKYLGSGISHFVEHMLFKGTEDHKAVGAIAQEVMSLGGTINASTSFDYTMYTLDLPRDRFDRGLAIIADMLMNSAFNPEEVEKERTVILGEMRLYNDNPDRQLSQLLYSNAYQEHPYKHPVIGYEPLFKSITREGLWDYYKSTYIPNNIILAVAGNVDPGKILPLIKEAFKKYPARPYPLRQLPLEPERITPGSVEKRYPTELTRLSVAFGGVKLLHRDMFAMDVLSMILGQGETSRLYKNIYTNKKLVHSISAYNWTPQDRGLFEIGCLLDESKIEPTLAAVREEIENIRNNGIDPKELEKTKRQVLSEHIFNHQTASAVADDMSVNEAITGDFRFSEKYVEGIRSVIPQDIQRVAREYLTWDKRTVAVLKPEATQGGPAAEPAPAAEAPIERHVLDNGLKVLIREDHTYPLVSVNLVLKGGVRQETADNNGIFELFSRLWVKGTRSRTAEMIAQSMESRGGGLGGFSGRNSFGLRLSVLSEDTGFGLDLLEDVFKHPTFPAAEFQKEMELMKIAIAQREDNISSVTSKSLRETLFLTHPSRLDPLGSLESVSQIKQPDLVSLYGRFCVPDNMVLTVFGDVNAKTILADIKKRFGALPKKAPALAEFQEDPPSAPRERTNRLKKEQSMVMFGFQGVRVNDPQRTGLEVLSSILGSSFQGRLFARIRDELGKSYTLGGGFSPGLDPGVIYFYVLTTDAEVENVRNIIEEEIEKLQNEPVADQELSDIKTFLKGTFRMGLETNDALGFMAALDELYGLGYEYYQSYEKNVDGVSAEDIRALARKYLDLNRSAVILTRPLTEKKDQPAP